MRCAQTARATGHGVSRGTIFDVRSFVVVLRFPSMPSSPGISALSVARCVAVRPPHGRATARRPVLEQSYTRMLKHITVDPFANPCSAHSYRCRCCVNISAAYIFVQVQDNFSNLKFPPVRSGWLRESNCFFLVVKCFPYPSVNSGSTVTSDAPQPERVQRSEMEHTVWKNADVLNDLAGFVGQDFLFFGGVSRAWRSAWGNRPAETRRITAHTSVAQLLDSLECGLHLAADLCAAAARDGRRVLQR